MPKSRKHRKGHRSQPAASRQGAGRFPALYGPQHHRALMGLAFPAPLTENDVRMGVPDTCTMPPEAVAATYPAVAAVLRSVGSDDLLGCEIVDGLQRAAAAGYGLELAAHQAKALWRFCDAFSGEDRRLAQAAQGLRVRVPV